MRQLYICYAESRRLYGRETYPRPSRFLREIPPQCIQEIRLRANITRPSNVMKPLKTIDHVGQDKPYKLGDKVRHAKFGDGVVLQMEGENAQARVQVKFKAEGVKWLMLAYAKFE